MTPQDIQKLKNDVMFNVLGFLFWDPYITEGDDKKKYKLYFPKVFAVISQYPYFQYYSFLCQNILNSFVIKFTE